MLAVLVGLMPQKAQAQCDGGESCVLKIELWDTYNVTGDGWNGNVLQILQDNEVVEEFTLYNDSHSGYNWFLLSVCSGAEMTVQYVASGSYQSENLYKVYNVDGELIVDGTGSYANASTDFTVAACPSCPLYSGTLVAEAVSGDNTSLLLKWDAIDGANDYEIAYGPQGFDPDGSEATYVSVLGDTEYELNGLTAGEIYEFYLRVTCSEEHGAWGLEHPVASPGTYIMSNYIDTVSTCGMLILDNGGFENQLCTGNYYTLVVRPDDDEHSVHIQGTVNLVEYDGYSYLEVYQGEGTNGTLVGKYYGNQDIDITALGTSLTLRFYDYSYNYYARSGFALQVSCGPLLDCFPAQNASMAVDGSFATLNWNYVDGIDDPNGFNITLYNVTDDEDVLEEYLEGDVRTYYFGMLTEQKQYRVTIQTDCSEEVAPDTLYFFTNCNAGGSATFGNFTQSSDQTLVYLEEDAYTVTQTFFHSQSENVAIADSIFGIQFEVQSGTATADLDIYLSGTSMDGSDYSAASFLSINPTTDLVYSHTGVTLTPGTNVLMFDEGWQYDGSNNLVLTVLAKNADGYVYFYSKANAWTDSYDWTYIGDAMDEIDMENPEFDSEWTSTYRANVTFISPCGDPNCHKAQNIQVNGLGTDAATVSWAADDENPSWKVELRNVTYGGTVTLTESTQNNSVALGTLSGGADYEVTITTLCESGETRTNTYTFTTPCDEVHVPVMVDFENFVATSYGEAETQNCWNRIRNNYGTTYYPYSYNYNYYAHSGNYTLYFPSGDTSALVSPAIAENLNELEVSFYTYTYAGNNPFRMVVGVCSDPTDRSTFEAVDTIVVAGGLNQFSVGSLAGYTGTGKHVYIAAASTNNTYCYLDDLTIDYAPTCDRIAQGSITVSSIGINTIGLTINDDRTDYKLYYGTSSSFADAQSIDITKDNTTLSGLNSATTYYLWIAAQCEDGSYSPVYGLGSYFTLCDKTVVDDHSDYTMGFENNESDAMQCISFNTTQGQFYSYRTSEYLYDDEGNYYYNYCYYFYGNAGNTLSIGLFTLPAFDMTDLTSDGELSFRLKRPYVATGVTEPSYYEVVYRTSETDDWTALTPVTEIPLDWSYTYEDLPNSAGASYYQVALRIYSLSYSTGQLYFDDFRVGSKTLCRELNHYGAKNVTTHDATIVWKGGESLSRVDVTYTAKGALVGKSFTVTDADSLMIGPLTASKSYNVKLQGFCGDDTINLVTFSFSTPYCNDIAYAYSYDEDDNDTASSLALMPKSKGAGCTEILFTAEQLSEFNNSIDGLTFYVADSMSYYYCYSTLTIYATPTTLNVLDNNVHFNPNTSTKVYEDIYQSGRYLYPGEQTIKFKNPVSYSGGNMIFSVVYSQYPNGYDMPLQVYARETSSNNVLHITVPSVNLIIDSSEDYYGNMNYTYLESCVYDSLVNAPADSRVLTNLAPEIELYGCRPSCYVPTITGTSSTAYTATLKWFNEGNAAQVSIREHGTSNWDTPTASANSNDHTFNQLKPMTTYDLRVRQACVATPTGFSDWAETSITTDTACSIPEGIHATEVTGYSAKIDWTDLGLTGGKWEIMVKGEGFNKVYTATTNPYTVTDLLPGRTYTASVRSYCGGNDHLVGDWSESISFQNNCMPATGLTATIKDKTNVVLEWKAGERNQAWVVTWFEKNNDVNEQLGTAEVTATTYTVENLKEGYTYTFRVMAKCDDGWYGPWSNDANANIAKVSIDDVNGNSNFSLQPNPATERVSIDLGEYDGTATITVMSVDGRQMGSVSTNESSYVLSLNGYAAGTYFVRVQTGSYSGVRKLVVK